MEQVKISFMATEMTYEMWNEKTSSKGLVFAKPSSKAQLLLVARLERGMS
jgi:hypothetical protein